MPHIMPFKGIRYNMALISAPGSVITPPYDVISPEDQDMLYNQNPYNVIRLEYGKSFSEDSSEDNRYSRTTKAFNDWLDQGILQVDKDSFYYCHEQTFKWRGEIFQRFGILAALKLEPYCSGLVLPHEKTMAGPKEDRFKLLKQTGANFSPIMAIFPDQEYLMATCREQVCFKEPVVDAYDYSGHRHRLWPVDDRDLTVKLTACLKDRPALIADGHHRYETALHYSKTVNLDRLPGAGYILTTLIAAEDPGLLMLPTHRLVSTQNAAQKTRLEALIEKEFTFINRGLPEELKTQTFNQELEPLAAKNRAIGFITEGRAGFLIPQRKIASTDLPLTILHERLLEPALAVENKNDEHPQAGSSQQKIQLTFTPDIAEALTAVLERKADKAFIIAPMPVAKVLERARMNLIMPRKSTYFYPKLPVGLVLYHCELSRGAWIDKDSAGL